MSEFWVSKKKYWCKYCETHIADDAPSRSQHENGLRHKGNKERFVRGLYKKAEQKKKDEVEEQREMARVDQARLFIPQRLAHELTRSYVQAARAAFAGDVSSGLAKSSSSSLPVRASATASASTEKPKTNVWANYTTAASLGITDVDAERVAAEAERHRLQGVAGEWTFVETVAPPPPDLDDVDEAVAVAGGVVRKREEEILPLDEDDSRAFKVRKKTWGDAGALGDLWEGDVPIKLKVRKTEPPTPSPSGFVAVSAASDEPQASERPKWTARTWNAPGSASSGTPLESSGSPSHVKTEETLVPPATDVPAPGVGVPNSVKAEEDVDHRSPVKVEDAPIKVEEPASTIDDLPPAPSTAGMFRKRRAPPAGVGSRARV
jgi:WW domain-binding protein 4